MAKYDDFTGFSFNGIHSSELGIVRISDGSRYNEDLLPTLQDKTIQVPGGDGTYYFGSYYTQRTFPIQFAFDKLSELQFRQLRQWIATRTPGRLVFDERPYKYYTAKISQTASTLKYLCFDDDNGQRVYKGEGTLNFVCYNPFAKSVHKFLSGYYDVYDTENKIYVPAEQYENIDQWKGSSGMLSTNSTGYENWARTYDEGYFYLSNSEFVIPEGASGFSEKTNRALISYYNCGDTEADFKLILDLPYKKEYYPGGIINIKLDSQASSPKMVLDFSKYEDVPQSITIDSKNNSIYNSNDISELYTGLLVEGDFFKLPITTTRKEIYISSTVALVFHYWTATEGRFSKEPGYRPANSESTTTAGTIILDYDYVYF